MAYKGRVRPTIALTADDIAADAVGTSEIVAGAVDTAEIATDAVTANEIAAGAVAASEIAATFDISSKTVTLPASAVTAAMVTAHVTSFDDASLRSDIATLALHNATDRDLAAENLGQSFIDVFQDDTGLDAQTTCDRVVVGEYMASVLGTAVDDKTVLLFHSDTTNGSTTFTDSSYSPKGVGIQGSGVTHSTTQKKFGATSINFGGSGGLYIGGNTDFVFDGDFTFDFWQWQSAGATDRRIVSNGAHPTEYFIRQKSNEAEYIKLCTTGGSCYNDLELGSDILSDSTWHHVLVQRSGTTGTYWVDGTVRNTLAIAAATYGGMNTIGIGHNGSGGEYVSSDLYIDEMRWSKGVARTTDSSDACYSSNGTSFTVPTGAYGQTVNATGNFTSETQTASGTVSKMSIIVIYKDNAGTATLNTDLVAAISANGGTNYQNVTLASAGTFSSGVKIAKASGVTVTNTGTAPKYKISFANQAGSSKETRIEGVALLY